MDAENILKNTLIKYNVSDIETKMNKFNTYFEEMIKYNKSVNLTSITERNMVYEKHFVDCILPLEHFKKNCTICDIGTGAGFPSFPLAISEDSFSVYAVDSLNKRIDFLNLIKTTLKLNNIQTFHSRAEDFAKQHREQFDYVVSRAVSKLNTLSEYCLPLVKIGGYMVAYKSVSYNEEIDESKKAIQVLGGKIEKILEYNLEISDQKRYIIFIKKIATTPNKYPRGQNKPKLQPL